MGVIQGEFYGKMFKKYNLDNTSRFLIGTQT